MKGYLKRLISPLANKVASEWLCGRSCKSCSCEFQKKAAIMYYSDFAGLDFLRVHAGMSTLPLCNTLDGTSSLSIPPPLRDIPTPRLSTVKPSPPHNRSTPSPGSATKTPSNFPTRSLSSGLSVLNLIHTPTSCGLKPTPYSPPPPTTTNPDHNICKLIPFRRSQLAAFTVDARELICLPQAFELFLKHLVGGLHTVYTKLKRLEITPVVCNVEQVRILRGLGAIQPGVNRCKLISCAEFDTLYDDCTNSNARPGRPAKRCHSTNPLESEILQKLKRRNLEIGRDYPYDQRFYDHKPLINGFSGLGYPSIPQLSSLFSIRHLIHPMRASSHTGLGPEDRTPKSSRETSVSGCVSPRPRDHAVYMPEVYRQTVESDGRLPEIVSEEESNKALNLQVEDPHSDNEFGEGSDDDCNVEDDNGSDNERPEEDFDEDYDCQDYSRNELQESSRAITSMKTFTSIKAESQFSDFESLVAKFNAVVRALVDAAKTVERQFGAKKSQMSVELVREKERCLELEREMNEERKKREFFQRRARSLKRALRLEPKTDTSTPTEQLGRPTSESSPEMNTKNTQECPKIERSASKRDVFEPFLSPNRNATLPSSPMQFTFPTVVQSADV